MPGFMNSISLNWFKFQTNSKIQGLEGKITDRQKKFGVDYVALVRKKTPPSELKECVSKAMEDVNDFQKQINESYDAIDYRQAVFEGGGVAGGPKRNAVGGSGVEKKFDLQIFDVPEAYKDADPNKWKVKTQQFQGQSTYDTKGFEETVEGISIKNGIEQFKKNPTKYLAMLYQGSMLDEDWPAASCKYVYVHREGTRNYRPQGVSPNGWMTILTNTYDRLPPFKGNAMPQFGRDEFTDDMVYKKKKLHGGKRKPLLPGRGMGVGDTPLLKIIGTVDPSDITQGQVGDCWLLSGISGLAEFPGAIKKLFRKNKALHEMPYEGPNFYTVTLWDLRKWEEVDVVVDERLPLAPNGDGLLAARTSADGELWVPILEKAIAVHCGGYDKLVGGHCTHAWSLLTGCKKQYQIVLNPETEKYQCLARYHPDEKRWLEHGNGPNDGEPGIYDAPWPKIGGGGKAEVEMSKDQVFKRIVAWDKKNYIIAAGTKGVSDRKKTSGLVDNHAYTVMEAHSDVAGTGVDLLRVRNPWGSGEIENGEFDDNGSGWKRYPQIKKLLNPVAADDGVFYVTKEEFFKYYQTIYLCASEMTEFLDK